MTAHIPPRTTQAAEGLPRRRFTVSDIEEMTAIGLMSDERNELIGGEVVPMSPKGIRHEILKTALLKLWYRAAPQGFELTPETTIRMSDDTFLEPDVVIYESRTGLAGLTNAAAAALLVVEVADSSRFYDRGRKAALYASYGVRELWVIDAVKRKTRVFRKPTSAGYLDVADVAAKAVATPAHAPAAFALRLADFDLD